MANAVFLQRTCIKTSLDQLPSTKSLPGWRVRVENRVPTQRQRVQSIIASAHGQNRSKGVSTRASPIEPTWSDASVLREESSETLKPDVGGGSGSGAGSIGRGGGGDGDGSEGNNNLPADLAAAVAAGKVSQEIVQRYLNLSTGLLAPLMKIGGFRDRLLADPSFLVKVGIEVGIGIFTKSSAEYAKRGENFNKELDFVLANVIMALVADFMLVWLPAPTLSFKPKSVAKSSGIMAFMASCPENAFQRVPPGYSPFTVGQRAGAVLRNGSKLLAVGFGASLFGVSVTNVLIALRQHLDPTWVPLNAPQNVLVTSAAYSSYMAVSSNLRYQIIAGIVEERGIEAIFASNPALCSALSFIVRTSNTFLGSLMWVDYLRLLGLQ